MSTSHTPGPWTARQFTTGSRFDWIVEAPDTDEVGYSSRIPARIARIEGLDFNNDEPFRYLKEERDEANARLIAAAPKLLAALHNVLVTAEHLRRAYAPHSTAARLASNLEEQTRAAIAKATTDTVTTGGAS